MAFCSNCGIQLKEDSKFCHKCGMSTKNKHTGDTNRHQEYAGKIIKCPNCGESLKAFTAICPACGQELNSTKVSNTLEKFIAQIDLCETTIANSKASNIGWHSWGKGKKIGWVILNILFSCIPLIIYWMYPLLSIKSTPPLSKEERQLVSLIENFPVSNDRASILEVLLYVKEKVDFLSKEKIDRKTAYWMRTWCAKAEQLKQKADLLFSNDTIVKDTYEEILADKKRVDNIIKYKAVAGGGLFIAMLVIMMGRNGTFEDIKNMNTILEIPDTKMGRLIPQIEDGAGKVESNYNDQLSIEYYGISEMEFESYKTKCKDSGFVIDSYESGSQYEAFNSEGFSIGVWYFGSSKELSVAIKDKMDMRTIVWPDSDIAKLIPIPKSNLGIMKTASDTCITAYIGNMTIDDFNFYVSECMAYGFTKDLSQDSKYLRATNEDGYSISVEYEGFNTIYIDIDAPKK